MRLAIESVLGQSFRDYELIVINDGSTDDSERLINSYNDLRIVYVRQRNLGEPAATNMGLRMARGSYITWVHSDDILPPNSFSARVACLDAHKDIDLCHGDILIMNRHGYFCRHMSAFDGDGRSAYLEYYKARAARKVAAPVHHTTIMFRKEFLPVVGFWDERLPCAMDMDWLLRALKFGRIKKVNAILYWYRFHPQTQRRIKANKGLSRHAMMQVILRRHAEV